MNKSQPIKRTLKPLSLYRIIILSLFLGPFFMVIHQTSCAGYDMATITPVLETAESFFSFIKKDNYSASWNMLSNETRETIISDVHRTYKKMGGDIEKEDIQRDFEHRGNIFQSYWSAFATNFNPDMILNDSQWGIGFIKEHQAEIIIRYKQSSNPAKLKLVKENGIWKVGLTESFWSRNYLN